MSRTLIVSVLVMSCALSAAGQSTSTLSEDEARILELTNAARKKEGLGPLKIAPLLMEAARAHSKNQAKQEKMAHELDGKKGSDRVKAAGYKYSLTGENVAFGKGTTVDEIFEGWMNSKGHRENILKKDYTEIGIGAAKSEKGKWYYTQNFGRPRK
jgi:uncharacterized protein YkwD